jgi:hypothetical protein
MFLKTERLCYVERMSKNYEVKAASGKRLFIKGKCELRRWVSRLL